MILCRTPETSEIQGRFEGERNGFILLGEKPKQKIEKFSDLAFRRNMSAPISSDVILVLLRNKKHTLRVYSNTVKLKNTGMH